MVVKVCVSAVGGEVEVEAMVGNLWGCLMSIQSSPFQAAWIRQLVAMRWQMEGLVSVVLENIREGFGRAEPLVFYYQRENSLSFTLRLSRVDFPFYLLPSFYIEF